MTPTSELHELVAAVVVAQLLCLAAFLHVRGLAAGMIPWWLSHALQHTLNSLLVLGGAGAVLTVGAEWPITQRMALIMHSCVLFMKCHSYVATNRALAAAVAEAESDEAQVVTSCCCACVVVRTLGMCVRSQ